MKLAAEIKWCLAGMSCAAVLFALGAEASAQTYPVRPVRFVVGTGQDMIARVVGEKLSAAWGQQ